MLREKSEKITKKTIFPFFIDSGVSAEAGKPTTI
jgi:hypothetical protein